MVTCDEVRSATLSRLDGVQSIWSTTRIAEHLDGCAACRAWEAEVLAEHQRSRHPAGSGRGVGQVIPLRSLTPGSIDSWPRYVLGVVAAIEVALGLGSIAFGAGLHPVRELAAADVAFAVGCLVAAIQPRRALGVVPVALALTVMILGTAAVDLLRGAVRPLAESHHVFELTGAAVLVVLARQVNPRESR